ncbi:MAG: 6-carboxyhexanoate--CoA ligase, partial [Desulfosporosinus sp.]|nr:6-carboxyhexanoate--CoA ligase [Desulfosporosinus sp.]
MELYSLKMRASNSKDGIEKHISGAEKIVSEDNIGTYVEALLTRALHHSKGKANFINLKIEKVNKEDILYLDSLPVSTVQVDTYQAGLKRVVALLEQMNIANAKEIIKKINATYNTRGAILLDVDTLERLEPNQERGIRATYMDADNSSMSENIEVKNHYNEAIVLATKVAYAPNIIGEICISDDPDYITGYVASKETGYVRITKLKEKGSQEGGRIFLYRGELSAVPSCLDYLEKQKV